MITIFWLSIIIILYHLMGYPIILLLIKLVFKDKEVDRKSIGDIDYPSVTVLCPAYNEASVISHKIDSFLKLDYPHDRIEMIIISDDSTDGTNEIVEKYASQYGNVKLVIQKPRRGKPSGHNMVEPTIMSDYIVSTDANSMFDHNAISSLINIIDNDESIGMISGNLKLVRNNSDSGEGYYWKFEKFLRKMESQINSIICSNGSLYIIRRDLFRQIHPTSVDDFERTLIVLKNGFKVKYNDNAIVKEDVSEKPHEEISRKIRIISREWFALMRQINLVNFIKFPFIAFALISHKIFRWMIGFFSILIFISNMFLLLDPFYLTVFLLQIVFYALGIIELILEKKSKSVKYLMLPAYFVAMIYSSIIALVKFLFGKQQMMWNTNRKT